MFFGKIVEESLPILQYGDPLEVLEGIDIADILQGQQVFQFLFYDLEDAGQHRTLLQEDIFEFAVSLYHAFLLA